jgi:DNA polymerase I-like protein with 3'-5' exonuclease and polymerase domains
LEWRTLLELSRDETGIREVLEQQDAHSLNEKAFNLPSRLIAKIYLFRTIYRGQGWSFANDPDFMHVSADPKFWDNIGDLFYKKYHGVDKCHKMWADMVTKGLAIEGPFGRDWKIEMKRNKRTNNLEIPWTTLTNYPVQGTGADIMMFARISFARRLKASGLSAILVSTVHDSILVDCPKPEEYQNIVNLFHQVFDDIPRNIKKVFNYDWVLPMSCECKIGKDMKNMKVIQRTDS